MSATIAVFGGDKRQVYMVEELIEKGYPVCTYQLLEEVPQSKRLYSIEQIFDCDVLIGPTPFTKNVMTLDCMIHYFEKHLTNKHFVIGGVLPPEIVRICKDRSAFYHDLMENEKVTILNAIATAEGTVMEAILGSETNLHGSQCLVLGFGRCAKVLAQKLKGLDAKVSIAARSKEALALACALGFDTIDIADIREHLQKFDYVFNTVPSLVLDRERLDQVKEGVLIIDIASAPGGVDFDYAARKGIQAKLCLGLPGKVAPKITSSILVDEIINLMKERMKGYEDRK